MEIAFELIMFASQNRMPLRVIGMPRNKREANLIPLWLGGNNPRVRAF